MLLLFCKTCNKKVEAIPLERPKVDFIASCPHCGSMLSPHRLLAPGTMINGFRVEREIGRGGMGIVYLAKQLDLDRDIALKILSDEMASDAAFINAFFREARGAAALNHPNIVQAIDAGTCGDLHYFVMELIDGENLEVYTAQKGALPTHLALKCATSIADALAYAWDCKKLAHRDIKPENIIMKNNSEFKLADLGLVKDCREGSIDHDENLMATPAYASPEVIRGEKDVPGFKSDMYSFGATLYQLFAGKAPFVHDDPMEVCEMQKECQPKPLIGLNPDLPNEISMLVDKLMEKDPNKRPDSWNAVLHKLNEISYVWHVTHDENGALKQQPSLPEDNKKQKLLIGAIAFLAVLLVAEAILFFMLPAPEQAETSQAEEATAAAQTPTQPETPASPETPVPPAAETAKTPPPPALDSSAFIAAPKEKEDPFEDLEDDPDELKNWKNNVKKYLPEDPYSRWESLQEYLEDNPYAPKEARKMFRDLEKKEKAEYIANIKKLKEKCFSATTPKNTLNHIRKLEKERDVAPLWAAEVFTLEELEKINSLRDEMEEKLAEEKAQRAQAQAEALEQKKRRQEQAAAKAKAQKEQQQMINLMRAANTDFQTLRARAFYCDDEEFETLVSGFEEKYQTLPDFKKRKTKLARVIELRTMVCTSPFEVIRLNAKIFEGKEIFPTLMPGCTLRKAEKDKLSFIEKKGRFSSGKKVPFSWGIDNRRAVVDEILYQNHKYLQKMDEDSLVLLFAIAHRSGFPVLHYLETRNWISQSCKDKTKKLLKEIIQIQQTTKQRAGEKRKSQ